MFLSIVAVPYKLEFKEEYCKISMSQGLTGENQERILRVYITNSTPQQASHDNIYTKVPRFVTQLCFHNQSWNV